MRRYGVVGQTTNDFLTYGGRVLTHTNSDELEFLLPTHRGRVREVPPSIPDEQCFPLRFHPQFEAVTWPLDRSRFKAVTKYHRPARNKRG